LSGLMLSLLYRSKSRRLTIFLELEKLNRRRAQSSVFLKLQLQ
jgi:hypothetical protein